MASKTVIHSVPASKPVPKDVPKSTAMDRTRNGFRFPAARAEMGLRDETANLRIDDPTLRELAELQDVFSLFSKKDQLQPDDSDGRQNLHAMFFASEKPDELLGRQERFLGALKKRCCRTTL